MMQIMLNAILKTRACNSAAIFRSGIVGFIQSLLLPRGVIAVIPAYVPGNRKRAGDKSEM